MNNHSMRDVGEGKKNKKKNSLRNREEETQREPSANPALKCALNMSLGSRRRAIFGLEEFLGYANL